MIEISLVIRRENFIYHRSLPKDSLILRDCTKILDFLRMKSNLLLNKSRILKMNKRERSEILWETSSGSSYFQRQVSLRILRRINAMRITSAPLTPKSCGSIRSYLIKTLKVPLARLLNSKITMAIAPKLLKTRDWITRIF